MATKKETVMEPKWQTYKAKLNHEQTAFIEKRKREQGIPIGQTITQALVMFIAEQEALNGKKK